MSLNKVFKEAEQSRNEAAELCSRLIQFNTAHPIARTDECVAFIKEYLDRHSIKHETYTKDPLKPNLVAKIPGKSKRKILWVGHLDVVPEGKPESWTHPPYSGKITDDGLVYGRGSSDMKGGCASAMVAARILNNIETLPNNVEFWFTADEEVGGGDGAKWLAETKHFQGDVCIIGDGEGGGFKLPSIDIGCKGSLNTRLTARGRTAHGSTPYLGDNAITKLMTVTPFVEKLRSFKLELPAELEEALDSSAEFLLKTTVLDEEQKKAVRRLFHYPTVSCNIISGGVRINVVPDYAEAEFDIRLTPGSKPPKVIEKIKALIKEAAIPGVEVSFNTENVEGYYEPPKTVFASKLAEAVQKATGRRPLFKILTGGTDAISIKRYTGIPCLGYGNSVTEQAHQSNEYNTIENLILGVKVYSMFPLIYNG